MQALQAFCNDAKITMTPVPRSALLLGLAGLLPFLWGIATQLSPTVTDLTLATLGPRFVGPYVSLSYGVIILSFMSGVLWGFATQAHRRAALYYSLSVLPALWAFFFVGNGPVSSAVCLGVGFVGLLGLDWLFWKQGLAPDWWMQLRAMLTIAVLACLFATTIG